MDHQQVRHEQKLFDQNRHARRALNLLRSRKGFTMFEMLVTSALITAVAASFFATMSWVGEMQKINEAKLSMNTEARLALAKMVWGYEPAGDVTGKREGIRSSTGFTITNSGKTITFVGSDGLQRIIRVANNNTDIEYRENNSPWDTLYTADRTIGDSVSTSLTFTQSPTSLDVVQIKLVLQKRILGRWEHASFSTQVSVRN